MHYEQPRDITGTLQEVLRISDAREHGDVQTARSPFGGPAGHNLEQLLAYADFAAGGST